MLSGRWSRTAPRDSRDESTSWQVAHRWTRGPSECWSTFLDWFDPGKSRSLVLVEPELTTEILLRANRGNAIPTSTPGQDILSPQATSLALRAVSQLPAGTIMVADSSYLGEAPYSNPAPTLTELAVWQVRRWFDLRTLTQTADGLTVSRLTKRLAVPRQESVRHQLTLEANARPAAAHDDSARRHVGDLVEVLELADDVEGGA